MRIAILTLPLHINYGGILQAYALQTILERMGHEVSVLQPERTFRPYTRPLWKWPLSVAKRILQRIKGQRVAILPPSIEQQRREFDDYDIISQHTSRFINQYIHTHIIKSFEDISETDFDAFVVGSDQVWRELYFCGFWSCSMPNAFLAFTKGWNIQRIAYAASFGIDKWEITETDACAAAARMFNLISVREESGVALCKRHLQVDATHVLDPTMLLEREDYSSLVDATQTPHTEECLAVYVLDLNSHIEAIVTTFAKNKGLNPVFTNNKNIGYRPNGVKTNECVQPPVESWLRSFMDAKFVITDSFHACVFCIIFNKPFAVLGNKNRGNARFASLLKQFGLEIRMVKTPREIEQLPDINWTDVNSIRSRLKKQSLSALSRLD